MKPPSINPLSASSAELCQLLEALCEDRITPAEHQRLERLVLTDVSARRAYLAYLDLHGTLYWNTAFGTAEASQLTSEGDIPAAHAHAAVSSVLASTRQRWQLWITVASVALLVTLSFALGRWFPSQPDNLPLAENDHPPATNDSQIPAETVFDSPVTEPAHQPAAIADVGERSAVSEQSALPQQVSQPQTNVDVTSANRQIDRSDDSHSNAQPTLTKASGSVQAVVSVINEHLAAGWKVHGVEPSPRADDAEWLRRVYLDIVGHIPPLEVAEKFLENRDVDKREKLVDQLLDDADYYRNWSTIWTNLLIGRSDSRDVNRPALKKFLRESFARNLPWNEIVADLISAEGRSDREGAANFLLAHLNNDAMPATAITSRLFLGRQIACTQCHDHPFNNWKQEEFWSYHSFFEQTVVARANVRDDKTGTMRSEVALQTNPRGGPTYYETRRGLAQVAYPRFEGTSVSDDAAINRRQELAKLMTSGNTTLVAESLVNRMWEHFLGCAFTRPVDDMGPHNPPSHPELLDHLARQFVQSGYDIKQLVRWICLSDAYQRTSQFGKFNDQDDPASGVPPLFSRVYVKSMTAEQLYDSLLLATGADKTPLESGEHERRRHQWLQQFVHAFQTDENDESLTFESTITQALLMMNSELIATALSLDRGTLLEKLAHAHDSDMDKLKRMCLATLTRLPTSREQSAFRKLVATGSSVRPSAAGWQDALWAYLNSSEFVLVH